MYTDWNESVCLFIFLMSDSLPGVVHFCRYVHEHTVCTCTYIIHNKVYINKVYMYKVFMLQITVPIYRNKSPPKNVSWPLPSETGNYDTHLAGFLWGRQVSLGSVQYTHSTGNILRWHSVMMTCCLSSKDLLIFLH